MDMGSGKSSSRACKISMLWNWTTVDACFLSKTWHVRSKGGFAGTVLGVFFLVIAIEAVRRLAREYDRIIVRRALSSISGRDEAGESQCTSSAAASAASALGLVKNVDGSTLPTLTGGSPSFTPSCGQQLLRSAIYGSQFTASFLVMLLGMYYNGYILFAIFIGHTVGYALFGRDTVTVYAEGTGSGHCC